MKLCGRCAGGVFAASIKARWEDPGNRKKVDRMTRERLCNLRVMDGREMYLQAQLEQLPPIHPKRPEILAQLEADRKERDYVYRWIESIPDDRTANIIALRYVKNAKWEEIAGYIGGIGACACKKISQRYLEASERREDEAKTARMIDAVTDAFPVIGEMLGKDDAK